MQVEPDSGVGKTARACVVGKTCGRVGVWNSMGTRNIDVGGGMGARNIDVGSKDKWVAAQIMPQGCLYS